MQKDVLRMNIIQQEIWICKTINETNFNRISCNDIFCGFDTLRYLFHHLQLFQQHTWLCYHHIICSYTVWWCSEILHIILCIMLYISKMSYQKHNFQINRNMKSNVLNRFKCTNMIIQYKKSSKMIYNSVC